MNEHLKKLIDFIKGDIEEIFENFDRLNGVNDDYEGYQKVEDVFDNIVNLADTIRSYAWAGSYEARHRKEELVPDYEEE